MEEIWKDAVGYEGIYSVSNTGRVKSMKRNVYRKCGRLHQTKKEKIMKLVNDGTYLSVELYKDGVGKKFSVHQLVAMSFLNHNPNKTKLVVDHIDNNPLNNMLTNLQVISVRENSSKDKKGFSSKYVGVSWSKAAKKWMSYIIINSKFVYLGCYNCEFSAHVAYVRRLKLVIN